MLPVVRIQSRGPHAPANVEALAAVIRGAARDTVQIDFDARPSEYSLYRTLLLRLNQKRLSVTALASWCAQRSWLDSAPVNEMVPMLFRMGHFVRARHVHLESEACQGSIGLSTDEPWPDHRSRSPRRIYLFNPHAWTPETYALALTRLQQWQSPNAR